MRSSHPVGGGMRSVGKLHSVPQSLCLAPCLGVPYPCLCPFLCQLQVETRITSLRVARMVVGAYASLARPHFDMEENPEAHWVEKVQKEWEIQADLCGTLRGLAGEERGNRQSNAEA